MQRCPQPRRNSCILRASDRPSPNCLARISWKSFRNTRHTNRPMVHPEMNRVTAACHHKRWSNLTSWMRGCVVGKNSTTEREIAACSSPDRPVPRKATSWSISCRGYEQKKNKPPFGICAPNGVAAINVDSSTLHLFFWIGFGTRSLSSLLKKVTKNKKATKCINETSLLIIGKYSMLSSDLIETPIYWYRWFNRMGNMRESRFGVYGLLCLVIFSCCLQFIDGKAANRLIHAGDRSVSICLCGPDWDCLRMSWNWHRWCDRKRITNLWGYWTRSASVGWTRTISPTWIYAS